MAFEQPYSNPSTPPFSTHLIHNFWLYLMRFRLRTLLIVTAAIALLCAQYPFVRVVRNSWTIGKGWQAEHRPDDGFLVVAAIELVGGCIWFCTVARKRRYLRAQEKWEHNDPKFAN
jgi:hypothetical protein